MKFTFTCKKVPLNDSVKDYAEKKISKLDRYFPEEAEAFVTFAVEKKNRCVVELTIRSQNGTLFRAEEAILQMNLLDHSFYVFRNVETETVSVVYRRNNGGYGLIETD